MLTLFSILILSFLVFSDRQRSAAHHIHRSERGGIDDKQMVESALAKLLVGTDGPDSSLWGHDLLGDLYGMRDGVEGRIAEVGEYPGQSQDIAPTLLMGSQFLRFPTTLHAEARFPQYRDDVQVDRQYPAAIAGPASTKFPVDDQLTGRLITFSDGPLGGITFEIVRSFGDHRNVPANMPGRETLTGQIVIDLRPRYHDVVTIGGIAKPLIDWLRMPGFSPHRLFYDGVISRLHLIGDRTPAPTAHGGFYINGRILNGQGLGWDRTRSNVGNASGPFNLNEMVSTRLDLVELQNQTTTSVASVQTNPFTGVAYTGGGQDIPVSYQPHYGLHRLPGQFSAATPGQAYVAGLPPGDTDESYDAADHNNLWLSYFPHDRQLGEPTPSFVRPSILNWILNQHAGGTLALQSSERLRDLLRAIQRSTLRPLPLTNDPMMPDDVFQRGAGVLKLSYADFSGSNSSGGLRGAIDFSQSDHSQLVNQIVQLARALAGSDDDSDGVIDSWDVDNNRDGHVDGVWIDAGLPISESKDGQTVKPLVSFMVEDLGGRLNVNLAGNVAQARYVNATSAKELVSTEISGAVQHDFPLLRPLSNLSKSPFPAGNVVTVNDLPVGFGYGPAEIDIRALFPAAFASPDPFERLRFGPQRLLGQRYGMSSGAGESVSAMAPLSQTFLMSAGAANDLISGSGNDWVGALRHPARANLHDFRGNQGLPTDAFGRMTIGLDLAGGVAMGRGSHPLNRAGSSAGDSQDDPYEFAVDAIGSPDAPYGLDELEPLLRFDGFEREFMVSRLLDLIEDYHGVSTPDPTTAARVRDAQRVLADSITTHSNSAAVAVGTLPLEFRFSSDAARAAASPQQYFSEAVVLPTSTPANQRDQLRNALLWDLLPPSVRSGRKLNLNRPLGNGINDDDDNGDGVIAKFRDPSDVRDFADVIDDPQEVAAGERHLPFGPNAGSHVSHWASTRGDVTPGSPGRESRAELAKHLYVLAMFLTRDSTTSTSYQFPVDGSVPFVALDPPYQLSVEDEYRAWKLAQWAVNVVDFRDTDAIMTRFAYDPNPYDGWHVLDVGGDPNRPSYRVVWGLEFPELTLEESLAFHDRKVRDTDRDGDAQRVILVDGNKGEDTTADQYQLPEGSLFLELRSTRSPQPIRYATDDTDTIANPMAFSPELYQNVGTVARPHWVLKLAAEAPDHNPVWRVAITKAHSQTNRRSSSPDFLLQPVGADVPEDPFVGPLDRDTVTLDPNRPQFLGSRVATTPIDRVVWFTSRNPDANNDGQMDFPVPNDSIAPGKVFYNRNGSRYLSPGQIALVAPRVETRIGNGQYDAVEGNTIDENGKPLVDHPRFVSKQRIRVADGKVGVWDDKAVETSVLFDQNNSPVGNASAPPVTAFIAQSNPPRSWSGSAASDRAIGLNVSEPYEITAAVAGTSASLEARDYYAAPTHRLSAGFPLDSWHDFDAESGVLPDEPFDSQPDSEIFETLGLGGQRTGTRTHYKTAYLQRLADPTLPYDQVFNPYISVDYISIDLTVFNGSQDNSARVEEQPDPNAPVVAPDPQLPDPGLPIQKWLWPDPADDRPYDSAPIERFASRSKTGMPVHLSIETAAEGPANLTHSVNTLPPAITPTSALPSAPVTDTGIFRVRLNVSPDVNESADYSSSLLRQKTHCTTLGWTNQTYGRRWQQTPTADARMTPFVGLPFRPWLSSVAWLNRDFVSADELMWVPTSSPGRLAIEFGTASPASGFNHAQTLPTDANLSQWQSPQVDRRFDFNRQFPHMFDYFNTSGGSASPNLLRLLEWVEIPPPFDADVDFVSPESNPASAGEDSTVPPQLDYASFYHSAAAGSIVTSNPLTWTTATANQGRQYDASSGSWTSGGASDPDATHGFWTNHVSMEPFRPPMSFRSKTFRRGLVNLNTIKNQRVFKALMHGFSTDAERAGDGAFWTSFLTARRGYSVPPPAPGPGAIRLRPFLDEAVPSQIAGVFQASNSADIEPPLQGGFFEPPIAATRLRPSLGGGSGPLFQRASSLSETQSHERSVVHQQLGITRLANLTSDQSNVFAVWITIGYFKVDKSTMTVGRELGSDDGSAKRPSGFFIIDRSVPVKYEPGRLNNAFDTVQLSRINR